MKPAVDALDRNEDVQQRATIELKEHANTIVREMASSSEASTKFMNSINRKIFALLNSHEVHERIGGILAIDRLLDVEGEENTTKITRFANYLRIVLPNPDPTVMALAAKALGIFQYLCV